MTNTQATQSDELFVDITGKWIRGSFLAWYRRYGLDVTGYPITDQFTDTSSGLATQYFQRLVMEEYPPGQIRLKLVGQDALALQQEVASLQDQVADLREQLRAAQAGGGTAGSAIPKPEMQDITDQLPRNPDGFQHRAVDDIHYVVINHTGGPATVAIETLASYHQQRGYPGLAYHYVITGDGAIQQTNPLTDTVSSLGYLGEGVNVAIAGSFDDYAPGDTQLEAAARLCAWLLQELHLTAEAVKGVSEFVTHGSPGWQWLHGSSYKNRLLALIEEVQPEPGQETPPVDGEELARLRAQVSDLQASIQTKEAQIAGLNSQVSALQGQVGERDGRITSLQSQVSQRDQTIADLRAQVGQKDQRIASLQSSLSARDSTIATQKAEISRLQAALEQAQAGGGAGPGPVTKPDIHDVTDQLIKHPTLRYDTRPLKQITHICIHHSAVSGSVSIEAIAEYHVKDRGWPGIGYHFYVKPDGTVYQTNRMETISWHVANNNHYTVGVCVSGDFTYAVPPDTQVGSAARLVAWLMDELDVPEDRIMGHKEYPENDTSCPGETWLKGKKWKDILLSQVQSVRGGGAGARKALNHYMLFWQKPDAWAQQDWEAAVKYIGRFRPTAGFSTDDARAAEYVTIVGGVAGVSYEAEQLLRASGCQVERLAGVDFADTKRILDELADSGRRFLNLPA